MVVMPLPPSALRAASPRDEWSLWTWWREVDAPALAQAARELGIRVRFGEQCLLLLGTPMVDVWLASPAPTPGDGFWTRVVALLFPAPSGSCPSSMRVNPRGLPDVLPKDTKG